MEELFFIQVGDLPPDSSLEDFIRRWHAEEKESGAVLDFATFEKKFHVLLGLSFPLLQRSAVTCRIRTTSNEFGMGGRIYQGSLPSRAPNSSTIRCQSSLPL